jgi:hypothetical protein
MLALENLKQLGRDWYVDLACNGDEWILTLTGRGDGRAHVYISADLERVINHAWSGAPDGRC